MKKKILLLITALVMIACTCLGLVACADKQLSAPANVKVQGNTLSWDAVKGAESYTVKINDDESTNNVTATSLDLTTVTAKLKSGKNVLSVRANATDKAEASEYSATAEYTYTPAPAKGDLAAPQNVKVQGNTLSWDAVTGATNGYTVKINNVDTNTQVVNTNSLDLTTIVAKLSFGENSFAVKANATDADNESSYTNSSNKYSYTPAFEQPTNVKVQGNTLSWDAVTGATNGYTVKINNVDTNTVTVNTNSLDLTTITEKLKSGENTFEVMVNATNEHDESAYASSSNSYSYVPPVEQEIADMAKLLSDFEKALADFEAEETVANAEAVKSAITAMSNKYDNLSPEAKEQVDTQAQAAMAKVNEFNTYYLTAQAKYNAFVEALNATLQEVDKEESLTALNQKIAALRQAQEALGTGLAGNMVTEEQVQQGQDIGTAWTTWTNAINAAKQALTLSLPELTDDASAEEIVVAVAAARTALAAANYPQYVTTDTNVAGLIEALATADQAAIAQLTSTVNALKGEVDDTINAEATLDANYYNSLLAIKEKIQALGAHAQTLWNDEDTAKLNAEIARVENTPVETLKGEAYSVSGVTLKVTVFRTFINGLGDKIAATGDNAPTLAVLGNGVTVEQEFTANSLNEYIAVIKIENTGSLGEGASYTVTMGVAEEPTALNFGEGLNNNPYFSNDDTVDGFKSAISNEGKFIFTFQNGCDAENYYLDVYMQGAIVKDESFVKYTQMPVGKIDITEWSSPMSMDELNRRLATELPNVFLNKGDVSVHFAIYGTKTDEDGKLSFTTYNASVISGAITFNITQDDLKERIFFGPAGEIVWNDGADAGTIVLGGRINEEELKKQFGVEEMADVYAQLRYVVSVTLNGVTKEFSVNCTGGSISAAVMKRNVYNLFEDETATEYKVKIRLALREDSSYADRLRDSNETAEMTWAFTVSLADTQLNIASSLTDGKWSLGDKTNETNNRWEVVSQDADLHDGVNIYAYLVGDKDVQEYDFFGQDTPFATYTHRNVSFAKWSDIDAAILEAVRNITENRPTEATFVFVMQWVANDKAIELGYSDSIGIYATTDDGQRDTKDYEWNWTLPTGNQFRHTNETILFQGFAVADDIIAGRISYMELHFATSNNPDTYNVAYVFYDSDSQSFVVYTNVERTGASIAFGKGSGEYYVSAGAFNEWLKTNYDDVKTWMDAEENAGKNITDNDEWYFRTKLIDNVEDGAYLDGDGLSDWLHGKRDN